MRFEPEQRINLPHRAREDAHELLPTEDEKMRLRNRASVFGRQLGGTKQDLRTLISRLLRKGGTSRREPPAHRRGTLTVVYVSPYMWPKALQADPETKRMFDEFLRATEGPDFIQEYAARHAPPAAAGELAVDHFAGPNFHGLLAQFPYNFTRDNPFVALPTPYEDAVKLYQDGELRDAILAFEAEVQRNPHSSEAWRWLGTAHAENDEDKLCAPPAYRFDGAHCCTVPSHRYSEPSMPIPSTSARC